MDHGTVAVQPAGPAGKRQVFLNLSLDDGASSRRVELVLSERAASRLGQALVSGSAGILRDFDLADDGYE